MNEELNREELSGSYRISRDEIPREDSFNQRTEYQPRYDAYQNVNNPNLGGSAEQGGGNGNYYGNPGYNANNIGAGYSTGGGNNSYSYGYQDPYQGPNQNQGDFGKSKRQDRPRTPRKKNGGFLKFCKLAAAAAVFGLIAGAVFQAVDYTVDRFRGEDSASAALVEGDGREQDSQDVILPTTPIINQPGNRETDVTMVVESSMPSIVSITSTVTQSYQFWGQIYDEDSSGSGSGIIIGKNDKELLVATNNHVVDGAKTIGVMFIDNESVEAEVKGTDRTADLAVLSIKLSDMKKDTLSKIKVASIGDSEQVKIGERVVAIGNALGYGQSVTVGYISAKDRTLYMDNQSMTLLQTDAAINPGNSGGALLNMSGEVIGINSVKLADTAVEGIGYAIPISKAVPIMDELKSRESFSEEEKGYLGVTLEDVTEAENKYNMPVGVFVTAVAKESAAKEAGILVGDIITKVNGSEVKTRTAVQERIGAYRYGTKVTITVMRYENGKYNEKEITATLKERDSLKDLEEGQQQPQQQIPDTQTIPDPYSDGNNTIPYGDLFDFFNQEYSR